MGDLIGAIYRAPDRDAYAIQITESPESYLIPVLTFVYEAGTDDPQAIAKRLLVNAGRSFWCTWPALEAGWAMINLEKTPPKWRALLREALSQYGIDPD